MVHLRDEADCTRGGSLRALSTKRGRRVLEETQVASHLLAARGGTCAGSEHRIWNRSTSSSRSFRSKAQFDLSQDHTGDKMNCRGCMSDTRGVAVSSASARRTVLSERTCRESARLAGIRRLRTPSPLGPRPAPQGERGSCRPRATPQRQAVDYSRAASAPTACGSARAQSSGQSLLEHERVIV